MEILPYRDFECMIETSYKLLLYVLLDLSYQWFFIFFVIYSKTVKERAYSSLVRPKLEYNNCVWDPHTKSQIHQLEMVQCRAATWARYTCNSYHNTSSVTEMLQTLNWPTLEKRRIRTRIIFLYKIIHHLVAISPINFLIQSDVRLWVQIPLGRGVFDTTLCDKVC